VNKADTFLNINNKVIYSSACHSEPYAEFILSQKKRT